MSLDFEQQLRDSLRERSQSPVLVQPDPLTAFNLRERRHRRARRTRWAGFALGSAALVAALTTGVVTLPHNLMAATVHPAHDHSVPGRIQGSLAGDTSWLYGVSGVLHQHFDADQDHGGILDDKAITWRYAGRLDGASMALVTVTQKDRNLVQWWGGTAGQLPGGLFLVAQAPAAAVVALTGQDSDNGGHLVVMAPPGAQIWTGTAVTYLADGSVQRALALAPAHDGLAIVKVALSDRPSQMRVRVTQKGQTLYDGPPTSGSWARYRDLDRTELTQALSATRGTGATRDLTANWSDTVLEDAGVVPEAAQVSLLWAGTIHERRTALVRVAVKGGGTLFYALDNADPIDRIRIDLRLLAPAGGADRRPIGWRLPAGKGTRADEVAVLTPPGTARAEVVSAGRSTELHLDQNGFALTQVPQSGVPAIRAYDSSGTLLGQTDLPAGVALVRAH